MAYLVNLDDLIVWLCDEGDHDGCDGYACLCCARGHVDQPPLPGLEE